jgi:hypothetical protein
MSDTYKVTWYDDQVIELSEEQLKAILTEFGLTAEGFSKKELQKGHGVLTGTLRRSIHLAQPDYAFGQDNVEPSESSPERGGSKVEAEKIGKGKFALALGSGLKYALKIHQGWGSFPGYHYITNGIEKAKAQRDAIVARHQVQ